MGSLLPLEPRLAKKLAQPLSDIIENTAAKSLLFECVNCLLCGPIESKNVLRLCLEKLKNFIEDHDQNRMSDSKRCRVVSLMIDWVYRC